MSGNLNDGSAQGFRRSPRPDAVRKLSEKLTELVGDGGEHFQNRNEQGQLLNEEGLPIIDITEPIHVSDTPSTSLFPDEDLPPSEQERRRRERDRVLDLLEQEEQREHAKEDELSQEQRQEILRKRKQAAQDEVARLKAAKAMQKKMGKALLQGLSESREETPDWGDVVPARLRSNSGRSLMSKAQIDAHPMKMQVVERIPGKPKIEEPQPDSDDESEPPDSPTVAGSDEEGGFGSDEDLVEEVDLDFVRHQREITLEYHEKRARMAETTSNAMKSQSQDQNDVSPKTAEESLNQSSRKPAISHFQANRLAASYNTAAPSSSQSLGVNVVPAASAQTLQRAIRVGKLDSDNRLVGGDAGESGSEDEAAMQEIMELLKKGEVYNLGPDGNFLHAVPPPSNPSPSTSAVIDAPPLTSRKPPTSKFKLARSGQRPSAAAAPSPEPPGSSTPPSNAARSSPKLPTPMTESGAPSSSRTNVLSSTVIEKSPCSAASVAFDSVIVSPSFPEVRRPQQPPTVARAADKPAKVSRFLAERM
ncbi:hypothetical protein B0H11DRAFT_1957866 [Mycena galericulata]|nr:hypothetical protein B0H11DRAFT_1957866 [Mycena galericulata]